MPTPKIVLSPRRLWRAWPFWLKVMIAAGLVFLSAAAGARWTGGRADFPAWLEAVATAAALLAAMFAVRYAANAWVVETQREERYVTQQERAQASLVAAWFDMHAEDAVLNPMGMAGGKSINLGKYRVYGAMVRNASDLPVTQVRLQADLLTVPRDSESVLREPLGMLQLGVLPPGPEPRFELFDKDARAVLQRVVDQEEAYEVDLRLTFRDASGVEWAREADGRLARATATRKG